MMFPKHPEAYCNILQNALPPFSNVGIIVFTAHSWQFWLRTVAANPALCRAATMAAFTVVPGRLTAKSPGVSVPHQAAWIGVAKDEMGDMTDMTPWHHGILMHFEGNA